MAAWCHRPTTQHYHRPAVNRSPGLASLWQLSLLLRSVLLSGCSSVVVQVCVSHRHVPHQNRPYQEMHLHQHWGGSCLTGMPQQQIRSGLAGLSMQLMVFRRFFESAVSSSGISFRTPGRRSSANFDSMAATGTDKTLRTSSLVHTLTLPAIQRRLTSSCSTLMLKWPSLRRTTF